MAAILGYADVLLGHLQDPDNRSCVMIMKRNGEHLLDLINDILDLSRIEAGKLDIEPERIVLPKLLADVQSLMAVRAEDKRIKFGTNRAMWGVYAPADAQRWWMFDPLARYPNAGLGEPGGLKLMNDNELISGVAPSVEPLWEENQKSGTVHLFHIVSEFDLKAK